MFVLGVDIVKSVFIANERFFAEVSAASEIAHIVDSFILVLVPHFFLELKPLGFEFHYLFIVLFLLDFEFVLLLLKQKLKFVYFELVLLKLSP
jgi:hypothetical protein